MTATDDNAAWTVRQVCCGRDDGITEHPTWEAADSWRNAYVESATDGHERTAIVTRNGGNSAS